MQFGLAGNGRRLSAGAKGRQCYKDDKPLNGGAL